MILVYLVVLGPMGGLWETSQRAIFMADWIKSFSPPHPIKVRYLYGAMRYEAIHEVERHQDDV